VNVARLAAIFVTVAVLSGCGGGTRQPAGQTPSSSRSIHRTFTVIRGEACVFSAPGTAFGLVGHVAWGFELTSGIWESGANEGPEYWPPRKADISKTWDETGSFSVMLAAFAEGGPYEGTS
jgi:hypothetical protein